MLVLSRKPTEEFHFPLIGATVRVVSVSGSRVKLGIEAPRHLEIRRGAQPAAAAAQFDAHELGNRLNAARLALYVAERHYAEGRCERAEAVLAEALRTLTRVEQEAAGDAPPVERPPCRRVLIVEDDPNQSRLLAGVLQLEGYDVATAADGQEAVERLETERPDFVLLDLRMPRLSGDKTLHAIRDDRRLAELKVYLMSATSPADAGLPVGPGGVDGWFPKPLDPAAMLAELRRCPATAA